MKRLRLCFLNLIILTFFYHPLTADSYSGNSDKEAAVLRAPVWVFLEPQPGTMTEEERGRFIPPRKALKELSMYLLSGMTYGWKFSYVPGDKTRAVKEFFEIQPIHSISDNDTRLKMTDLKAKYPYFYCHAEYGISAAEKYRMDSWKSVNYRAVKGRGSGARKLELDGVYAAYKEAAKNAVRSYGRKLEKNKPRSIEGELMIRKNPRLFIEAGNFIAELEMYISIREIVKYTNF